MIYFQESYHNVEIPSVTFCNQNSLRKSQIDLGGDKLLAVLDHIEDFDAESSAKL